MRELRSAPVSPAGRETRRSLAETKAYCVIWRQCAISFWSARGFISDDSRHSASAIPAANKNIEIIGATEKLNNHCLRRVRHKPDEVVLNDDDLLRKDIQLGLSESEIDSFKFTLEVHSSVSLAIHEIIRGRGKIESASWPDSFIHPLGRG